MFLPGSIPARGSAGATQPLPGSHTGFTHTMQYIGDFQALAQAQLPLFPFQKPHLLFSYFALRPEPRQPVSCEAAKGPSWAVSEHPLPRSPDTDLPVPPVQASRLMEAAAIIRVSLGFGASFNCT